jgi:hypothetical protein
LAVVSLAASIAILNLRLAILVLGRTIMGRTADELVYAMRIMDAWPSTAAIVDFGLVSQEQYEALYYPIKQREVTADQLHEAAMQGGAALTALARSLPSNPHKNVVFVNPYPLPPEPEEEEYADEPSDTDPNNPVNMSREAWDNLYSRNPDALEHGE